MYMFWMISEMERVCATRVHKCSRFAGIFSFLQLFKWHEQSGTYEFDYHAFLSLSFFSWGCNCLLMLLTRTARLWDVKCERVAEKHLSILA